jgi:N-acetylmuramoyl-L-alanine amidase
MKFKNKKKIIFTLLYYVFFIYFTYFYAYSAELTKLFVHEGSVYSKLVFFVDKVEKVDKKEFIHRLDTNASYNGHILKVPIRLSSQFQKSQPDKFNTLLKKNSLSGDRAYRITENNGKMEIAFFGKKICGLYDIVSDRFGSGFILVFGPTAQHEGDTKNNTTQKTQEREQGEKKIKVFIDYGHGGKDCGARSAEGFCEKDITRAHGTLLVKELRQRGYVVQTSRDFDEFFELDERTGMANRFNADLAISLHADSCARAEKSGASVRVPKNLSLTKNNTIQVARNEIASNPDGSLFSGCFFFEREEKDRIAHSNDFARILARELEVSSSEKTTQKIEIVTDPFQFLLGTAMPTILLELGFLSNKKDSQELIDPIRQESYAYKIANAVDRYFLGKKPEKKRKKIKRSQDVSGEKYDCTYSA